MATLTCPMCGTRFTAEQSRAMPFCSERCRQIDLWHWLEEDYSVPHEGREDEEEEDGGFPI